MLPTDPNKQFEELKARLLGEIGNTFPIKDPKSGLEVRVKNLEVQDSHLGTDDIKGQLDARLNERSYTAPIQGEVEVVDKDGKVLVSRKMKLAEVPKLTRHYTFIIGGQERSVTNQWRLRPGAYIKATEKPGEFEAQFQLAKGKSFDVQMEPQTGYMFIKGGARKIPLYSVLSASGVSDDEMRKAWGEQNFLANRKKADPEKDLRSFYTSMKDANLPAGVDVKTAVNQYLATTKMDPAVTKTTLGAPHEAVSGPALLSASKKLIDVSAERTRPDPIDSLEFKELWTPTDHFVERLKNSRNDIHGRVLKSLSKPSVQQNLYNKNPGVLRDIVMPDLLRKPISHVFATSLSSVASQTNPVAMLASHSQTTIMGPGGLKSDHQVTLSNTSVDPSQLGFVDPVFTPEGGAGKTTHLNAGVVVKDRKPYTKFYDLQKNKVVELTPTEAAKSVVVLPDQIKWSKGRPKPLSQNVRVSSATGDIEEMPFNKAQYALITPSQVFSTETNLIPFMQNDAAGRTTMSARHMAQAISLAEREAPKVQVEAAPGVSFEKGIGSTFLSHKTPIAGTVKAVTKDGITIRDPKGVEHTVGLYDHYPTNDKKGMLHSTPLVKPGDKVKAGQILADHSFSKNGELALGTNLRVAYLANGLNHEDAVAISESAAKKMATDHLLKPSLYVTPDHVISKNRFMALKGTAFQPEQYENIGDDGVIKVGATVRPGDPLVLSVKKESMPDTIDTKMLNRLTKKGRLDYSNSALTWDHEYPGEVVRVTRSGKNIVAHVRTKEPLIVGSKVSTRHSAKGIIGAVIPDAEMPRDAKGNPVEMLINPVSVPGRMNAGQILETTAGRIAEKTGKPYIVKNFDGNTDYLKKVKEDLKKHGIPETETLFDPKTGRKLGEATVGPHYVFQLEHQIDKKSSVRHGGAYIKSTGMPHIQYDTNLVPKKGGKAGAQSVGSLGVYAALAAGLQQNLGEMQTLKSDRPQAEALWEALSNGQMIPPPAVPFVYTKFGALMNAAGLNLDKNGSTIRLLPQTDDEVIKQLKAVKVTNPSATVMAKNMKPESGGIFDPRIFGPDKQKWGYIELATPMPNPIFAKPVAQILGVSEKSIPKIIAGEETLHGKTGATAIREALAKVNVDAELNRLKKTIDDPQVKGADLSRATGAFKALRSLKEQNKSPAEAYTMKYLPVLPPIYRPYQESPDGQDRIDPLNQLYRRVGMVNSSLEQQTKAGIPAKTLHRSHAALYDEMQSLMGTTPKNKKALDIDHRGKAVPGRTLPGILHTIAGESPKDGFFQDKMIAKKQDYTARATIVPDPGLSADEVGVPKKIAFELYRPLVANRLVQAGMDPFRAQTEISKRTAVAEAALVREVESRPVLMKRDPVLHQYGIIGQRVKLTDSKAIKVSPLVLPPLGGDADGDTVALMLPISHGAVQEAHKLLPSHRNISASTGEVLFTPTNESALALYRTSIPKRTLNVSFANKEEAEKAFIANKINLDDQVKIGGTSTTLGRARMAAVVPEQFKADILTKLDTPVSRKMVSNILHETAKNHPGQFDAVSRDLTQLGFKMAYESGHSVRLADLEPLRAERQKIISETAKAVQGKSDDVRTQMWVDATKKLHETYAKHHQKNPTNISDMAQAGIKAKKEQFQGMVMAPMLIENHLGVPSKVPVTRSFAEGVDVGGYFMQASGARRGVIQKVDAVKDPGVLTKELIQSSIDSPITAQDCGTTHGIRLPANDRDIVDRHLAAPLTVKGKTLPAGTVVTPQLQKLILDTHKDAIVRSPLKCRMPQGVCSVCMGKHPSGNNYHVGDNVGIVAAQAIGERASQLMLKQTHGQGIVPMTRSAVDEIDTVQRILNAAKPSPVDAIVAPKAGIVQGVSQRPQGGYDIFLRGQKAPLYSRQKPLAHVKPGHEVKQGDILTHGDPNLHKLLQAKGIDAVQDHMVQRIGGIYGKEDVLRRHVELVVRNTAGTVHVDDPGDHPHLLRGDHIQKTVLDEINKNVLKGKKPVKATPIVKSLKTITALKQPDWMTRLQSERLQEHIMTAAAQGQSSNLHGLSPIPGLAYGKEFGRGQGPTRY